MLFSAKKDKKAALATSAASAAASAGNGSATPSAAAARPATPVASAAAAPDALPPEEAKRRADYSHRVMQAFGAIVAIYMRSKAHRDMRLADIEAIVGPAVTTGQFSLAEATHKKNGLVTPVAVVLWASVSAAVDQAIEAAPEKPLGLKPADWKSGDVVWIVEGVGDQNVVGAIIKQLKETTWKGKTVKMRAVGEGGRIVSHLVATP